AATDDVYVLRNTLRRFDGATLLELGSVAVRQYTGRLTASLDGTRLFGNVYNSDARPLDPWKIVVFDSSTLATQHEVITGVGGLTDVGAYEAPGRDEALF